MDTEEVQCLSGPNSWFYPSFMNKMRISWLWSVGLPNNFKGCDSFFWNTDSSWGGLKNGRWERKLLSWEVWVSTSNMRLSSLKGQHYIYMDAFYKIKATMCLLLFIAINTLFAKHFCYTSYTPLFSFYAVIFFQPIFRQIGKCYKVWIKLWENMRAVVKKSNFFKNEIQNIKRRSALYA